MSFLSVLNNREISIIIWTGLFSVWAISKEQVRGEISSLIKAFFEKKLVIGYLLMFIYITIIISPLYFVGLWDIAWLKNTILWVACVAFVMLVQFSKINDNNKFIINTIKDNLKLLILLEFVINLYVFNLFVEILLLPILVIIGAMQAFTESDDKYKDVYKLSNYLLSIVGFVFIIYATYMILTDINGFISKENLIDMILPILLTIMFIPFIYLVALYSSYENLFKRIPYIIEDKDTLKYTRKKILLSFRFDLKQLNAWSVHQNTILVKNKRDIDEAIDLFKTNRME